MWSNLKYDVNIIEKGLTVMMLFLMRTPRAMTMTAIRTTATWEKSIQEGKVSNSPYMHHLRLFWKTYQDSNNCAQVRFWSWCCSDWIVSWWNASWICRIGWICWICWVGRFCWMRGFCWVWRFCWVCRVCWFCWVCWRWRWFWCRRWRASAKLAPSCKCYIVDGNRSNLCLIRV